MQEFYNRLKENHSMLIVSILNTENKNLSEKALNALLCHLIASYDIHR